MTSQSEDLLGRSWFGIRLPVFFQAPSEPRSSAPIRLDGASPVRFTWRVVFGARRFTLPGGLLLAVSMIAEALVPVIVGAAIDQAIAGKNLRTLLVWILVLGVDFAVLSFGFRFGSRMGLYGMQRVQHRLRTTVTDRLLHPAGSAHGQSDGQALSIATGDVMRLAATMQIGVYPVGEVAAVIFCVAWLFGLSWMLGLAAAVGAVLLILVMFLAGRPLQRRSLAEQGLAADAVGTAADLLSGYRVLKGLRAEHEAAQRYRRVSRSALAGTLRVKNAQGLYLGSMDVLAGLYTAGLTVLAGVLTLTGTLEIGGLIAAAGLIQFVVGPLTGMPANTGAVWARGVASARRVLIVLGASALAPEATQPDAEMAATPVLEATLPGLVLRAEPGECVGVRADQQTGMRLIRLLSARASGEGDGTATLDGADCRALGVEGWRQRVLVAPHRAELFDGTVAWNLDTPAAQQHLVASALEAAACGDVLGALPDGAETVVGEGGARLSGGQRQRVALARAYATDAPVLVLHDPTTAVDAATEAVIAERLRGMRSASEGRTTIIIASSPALLAVCDRVIDAGEASL